MTPIIDNNGIQIADFTDVLSDLEISYKEVYGDDIDLSQNTPDGQKIGIEAKVISDFNEFALALYNSFDPDFAMGVAMDKILKLNGLKRQQPTKSSVDITLVCSRTVSLPIDYKIKDSLNQVWVIDEAKTLNAGTHLITFYSENFGKFEALPNTINEFETIVLGVDSVNNLLSAVAGKDEDTDEEIRIKRNNLLMRNSTSTIGGLIGKLYDICSEVKVYENRLSTSDLVKSMNPHSLWIICDGGEIDEITQIIATETTGCELKGAISNTYVENFVRSNNEVIVINHENINFDRPTITDIYIRFNSKQTVFPATVDYDLMKSNLSDVTFLIGESINASSLYSAIYKNSSGTFVASGIEISDDNINWTDENLAPNFSERFRIVSTQITITVI